jgi:hypothetical protein
MAAVNPVRVQHGDDFENEELSEESSSGIPRSENETQETVEDKTSGHLPRMYSRRYEVDLNWRVNVDVDLPNKG